MKPRINFYGGVGDVTGANFQLTYGESSILVDCGMFQGCDECEERNYEAFPFDPVAIDALIVTHAHQDHIGRIPRLMREGFKGIIYSTAPTKELAGIMLSDALNVMTQHAQRESKIPLYEIEDIESAMEHWKTIPYHGEFEPAENIKIKLYDAGHILGSAMVYVQCGEIKILFSGDLGNSPSPLLHDTEEIPEVDYVVMESVYGDRVHEDQGLRLEKLASAMHETISRDGVLLIPAFSVERTQEILSHMNNLIEQGHVPKIPVYLDSPLAINVTQVYQNNTEYFKKEIRSQIQSGDDIFQFPGLVKTLTSQDSKKINDAPSPKIIIAGSGMMNGGRMLHHARHYLSLPNTTLLFVGYQAPRTLGRLIQDGVKTVRIFGDDIRVSARIQTISGYSGHKDVNGLVAFIEPVRTKVKKVFVTMGEQKSSLFLVQRLRDFLGVYAVAPSPQESVELE